MPRPSSLLLLLCLLFPATSSTEPTLIEGLSFLPFREVTKGYDRYGGIRTGVPSTVQNFGDSDLYSTVTLVGDLDGRPDLKHGLLVLVTDPTGSAEGTFEVHVEAWAPDPDGDGPAVRTEEWPIPVTLNTGSFGLASALGYDQAFAFNTAIDKAVAISTSGLGADIDVRLELWHGHQQEIAVSSKLLGLDAPACESGAYRVSVNGQRARPLEFHADEQEKNDFKKGCFASISPGLREEGLYFPYVVDVNYDTHDVIGRAGDAFLVPRTFDQWVAEHPYSSQYFDVLGYQDTLIRPIVFDLIDDATGTIIDRHRVLYYTEVDYGGKELVHLLDDPEDEEPGIFAQLTPEGLHRLCKTHEAVLPYPTHPLGIQPRLSQYVIAAPYLPHVPDERLYFELSEGDRWTDPDEPWAGSIAYRTISNQAQMMFTRFTRAIAECSGQPFPGNAICTAQATQRHCVRTPPIASHFEVEVARLETYFNGSRHPDDALSIGAASVTDLSFGSDQILATLMLRDIHGWLDALIDPDDVTVHYKNAGSAGCSIKPDDVVVGDHEDDPQDRDPWFYCHDLQYDADEATMPSPVVFDVAVDGERIHTSFAHLDPFDITEARADPSLGGTCAESWIRDFVAAGILEWEPVIEFAIAINWLTSPSQDETLHRLLSPFELGITEVTDVPDDTPSYLVHPNPLFDVQATIAPTAADAQGFMTSAEVGMYVPYIVSISSGDVSGYDRWICVTDVWNHCDGMLNPHTPLWPDGVDPDGAPFDVALDITPPQLNRVLHDVARREDFLGAPGGPATIPLAPRGLRGTADARGYAEVVAALDAAGGDLSLQVYERATPFTFSHDGDRLFLVVPEIVVEIAKADGSVAARIVGDIVDADFKLRLGEFGADTIAAAFSRNEYGFRFLTVDFLAGCFDSESQATSCADQLEEVVGVFARPYLEDTIVRMFQTLPAPLYFDAGQESRRIRQLKNARSFVRSDSVTLFADLCRRTDPECSP